jgi:hypothetical protein
VGRLTISEVSEGVDELGNKQGNGVVFLTKAKPLAVSHLFHG